VRTVAIDCFVQNFPGFRPGYAVIAVDVMRATTMAVTSVLLGRRCFPAATIDSGIQIAQGLSNPILAGELGGNMPYGFDLDNSPAALVKRSDTARPMVMVSTSGTQLICESAQVSSVVYTACLRNFSAQAARLVAQHPRVSIVGAGSRGEFREEDQLCAARIALTLVEAGYEVADDPTSDVLDRWGDARDDAFLDGRSAKYLRETGQQHDLDFVLEHVDDLSSIFVIEQSEVSELDPS